MAAALGRPGWILARPTFLGWYGCFLALSGFLWCHIDLIWLGCAAFKLAYRLTEPAADLGQFFPAEDDQRDDHDDDQFL